MLPLTFPLDPQPKNRNTVAKSGSLSVVCDGNEGVTSMVESHSTSLSGITCRGARVECVEATTSKYDPPNTECAPDPVWLLWTKWQKLHQRAAALCHEVQDLEAQLMRTVGAPMVAVWQVKGGGSCLAHSHEDIDAILRDSGTSSGYAEDLHRKLSALEERWIAEAALLGFYEAMQQESDAWAQEAEAAKAIFSTSAISLAGIQIKLAFMIEMCSVGPPDVMTLVPQLQSAFADVANLIVAS